VLERRRLWYVLALAGSSIAFFVCYLLALYVELSASLAYALAFMLVSTEILVVARFVVIDKPPQLALRLLIGVGALALLRGMQPDLVQCVVVGWMLLSCSSALGALIGARIENPGHLMAVAAMSTVADLWSVYDPNGISAKMAESAVEEPDKIVLFALPWPMLVGKPFIAPIIGAGDILFTALYLACFQRHGLKLERAMIGLAIAYAAGLVAILATERPVPLLPLLGAAILLADRRTASLAPKERRTVWLVVAVLVAVLIVRFLR
jgi:hypothetical protein